MPADPRNPGNISDGVRLVRPRAKGHVARRVVTHRGPVHDRTYLVEWEGYDRRGKRLVPSWVEPTYLDAGVLLAYWDNNEVPGATKCACGGCQADRMSATLKYCCWKQPDDWAADENGTVHYIEHSDWFCADCLPEKSGTDDGPGWKLNHAHGHAKSFGSRPTAVV
ncbi:hypothetical protein H2203_005588 [Taxawa tesnikishii (nom. ined.)]|nr:hypothetical protein H2203_005588 [Dothideales sp. JES 119]